MDWILSFLPAAILQGAEQGYLEEGALLHDQSPAWEVLDLEQAQYLQEKYLLLFSYFSNSHETASWLEE